MDNCCKVKIDNQEYYIECSRINDLSFIDGHLVNTSNTSITLVSSFALDSNTYPRITCSSMRACGLRTSDRYESIPVTNPIIIERDWFKSWNFESMVLFLLLLIVGFKMLWKN